MSPPRTRGDDALATVLRVLRAAAAGRVVGRGVPSGDVVIQAFRRLIFQMQKIHSPTPTTQCMYESAGY